MAETNKCFIIAPISTLTERASLLDDTDHSEHVIEHLLVPAVEKAGFEPVRPKVKGANLIPAEIGRNLQTAALVLCDMSGLNPNVFFELGIRTAMNKPICLIIDKTTKGPPFDLGQVSHHQYVSDLRPWILPDEIEQLARHITESAVTQGNALWKHFALRSFKTAVEHINISPLLTERIISYATDLGLSVRRMDFDDAGMLAVTLSGDDFAHRSAAIRQFQLNAKELHLPISSIIADNREETHFFSGTV